MKVVQKDDASGKEYEVIGIVILVGGSGFLYILLDGTDSFSSDVEIVDNRIPLNWSMRFFHEDSQFLAILGSEELTYSTDLVYWSFHAYTDAMKVMNKVKEKIRTKKFQEKLDYYDEYLDYSNLINKLEYKFIKDE